MSSSDMQSLSTLVVDSFVEFNPPKEIVLSFLKNVYHTIIKRSCGKFNFYILQELIDIPLIIIEKIFNLINQDNKNVLPLNNFIYGLYDLLFCDSEHKISLLFDLLDFDKDGFVFKCDVFLILAHFHLFQNSDEHISQLETIINNFFFVRSKMSKDDFIKKSINENSDIVMLLQLYIKTYCCFFGEPEIIFYMNNCDQTFLNNESLYNKNQISSYLTHNSCELKKYIESVNVKLLNNIIPIPEYEDNIELDDLEIFEYEVNEMFQMINQTSVPLKLNETVNDDNVRKNKTVAMKKAAFFKTNTEKSNQCPISRKKEHYSSIGSKKTEETSTISSILPGLSKHKTVSDIEQQSKDNHFYIHHNIHNSSHANTTTNNGILKSATCAIKTSFPNNYPSNELYCFKSKNNVTTNIVIKLKLIGAFIFYFKFQNNEFVFKKIIPIFSLYPKKYKLYSSSNVQFSLMGTVFNYYKQYTFFTENKSGSLDNFISLINKQNNVRNLSDYYEQKELLGKGKFGSVSIAEHKLTGKRYAVKTVSKNTPIEEEYKINRWERSISIILSNLNHNNIIKCYDSFDNVSHSYFVYEYIQGSDLKTFTKQELHQNKHHLHKKVDRITDISFQIIRGVGYLHKYGIIHRDIKHTNILIQSKTKQIKIIDFGLSRVIPKYEYTTDPYGSLTFKSPELILQHPYNFKVDIWAIGVTLYFLMYNAFPFDSDSKEKLKQIIVSDNVNFKVISDSGFDSDNDDNGKDSNDTSNYYDNKSVIDTHTNESDNGNSCILYALISDCLEKNVRDRPDIKRIVEKYIEKNIKFN